jgi:hypothetical protein
MIRIFRFASAALGKSFAVRLWHTADILAARSVMSAFGGKADIVISERYVRF